MLQLVKRIRSLCKHLRGVLSVRYYCNISLITHLTKQGYESDCFTPIKVSQRGQIVKFITVDYILVLVRTQDAIDYFYDILTPTYTVKHLGSPTQFLGCPVTYPDDGSITQTQPQLFTTTIANSNM